jgi:hypothetical protein
MTRRPVHSTVRDMTDVEQLQVQLEGFLAAVTTNRGDDGPYPSGSGEEACWMSGWLLAGIDRQTITEGMLAFQRGRKRSSNPYPEIGDKFLNRHEAWQAGWDYAWAQAKGRH